MSPAATTGTSVRSSMRRKSAAAATTNGHHDTGMVNGSIGNVSDGTVPSTDLARWRLKTSDGSHGRHTWHYLPDDPQALADWPQTEEDKYWLGLKTVSCASLLAFSKQADRHFVLLN